MTRRKNIQICSGEITTNGNRVIQEFIYPMYTRQPQDGKTSAQFMRIVAATQQQQPKVVTRIVAANTVPGIQQNIEALAMHQHTTVPDNDSCIDRNVRRRSCFSSIDRTP